MVRQQSGVSWCLEYTRLEDEIRVRHYSQKTLNVSAMATALSGFYPEQAAGISFGSRCQGIPDLAGCQAAGFRHTVKSVTIKEAR